MSNFTLPVLPDLLQCLSLEVGRTKVGNDQRLVLFDLDEQRSLIHLEDTPSNERLLNEFAHVIDRMVDYHRDQAFEKGKREGYAERSLEVKRAMESLINVRHLVEF